jgi:hypothetical protein
MLYGILKLCETLRSLFWGTRKCTEFSVKGKARVFRTSLQKKSLKKDDSSPEDSNAAIGCFIQKGKYPRWSPSDFFWCMFWYYKTTF